VITHTRERLAKHTHTDKFTEESGSL